MRNTKTNDMKTITLINPTKEVNGLQANYGHGCINSCKLQRISLSGRETTVGRINQSGTVIAELHSAKRLTDTMISNFINLIKEFTA